MTGANHPTTSLAITPGALGSLLVACWGEYPQAAHGVLAAAGKGHIVRVLMHATAAVSATTSCTSRIDTERIQAALQRARRPLHVAATFHTHLDGPAMPTADGSHCLTASEPTIIVGLQDLDEPDVRAWSLDAGNPQELRLVIEPCPGNEPRAATASGTGDLACTPRGRGSW